MKTIKLNDLELSELNKPVIGGGGYQTLIRHLQDQLDSGNTLSLNTEMINRIHNYTYKYNQGGWQGRLEKIFGRHLGEKLDKF